MGEPQISPDHRSDSGRVKSSLLSAAVLLQVATKSGVAQKRGTANSSSQSGDRSNSKLPILKYSAPILNQKLECTAPLVFTAVVVVFAFAYSKNNGSDTALDGFLSRWACRVLLLRNLSPREFQTATTGSESQEDRVRIFSSPCQRWWRRGTSPMEDDSVSAVVTTSMPTMRYYGEERKRQRN